MPAPERELDAAWSPVASDGLTGRRRPWRAGWFLASGAFLLYPIAHVLSIPSDPRETLLALLAVVIFGTVLARALLVDDGRIGLEGPLPTVAALVLLGLAAALTIGWPGSGWSAIGYFASVTAGGILPVRRALMLLALCGVVMGLAVALTGSGPFDGLLTGLGVAVIGFTVFALNAARRTNLALVAARAELARLAVLEERERIARDLHDTLGHSLSLITLKSELAGRLLPEDAEGARREIGDVEVAAREALASVRETVQGFRRPTLDVELAGVVGALRTAGIRPVLERDTLTLPPSTDALFAWAVREGVTNVMRHSRATSCTIRIGTDGPDAFAEVLDDGIGDPTTRVPVAGSPDAADGSGLRGLAERVADQGGHVVAGALTGRGYRLRVTLPLAGRTVA